MRNVVVTGAAGNLGQAVVRTFAAAGDRVIAVDRDGAALQRLYPAAKSHDAVNIRALALDLLDRAAVQTTLASAADTHGTITVLCNVAGGFRMGEAVHETSDGTWNFLMDLNARSVVHACAAVVPGMLQAGGGAIVNVAAAGALKGGAQMGAYAASKSAVMRLTESMAAELGPKGINANAVLPTIIDTPENRQAMPNADRSGWAQPQDVANVIAFLASAAASAVHGVGITVGR